MINKAKDKIFYRFAAIMIYQVTNNFGCSAFKDARINVHCIKIKRSFQNRY